MTPADKRELCAILRRVLLKQASKSLHAAINEIDAIEKEIEPIAPWCPYGGRGDGVVCKEVRNHYHDGDRNDLTVLLETPCPTQTSETSGAPTGTPARPVGTATIVPTTTSLPTDNPPDLDAIRGAVERLRDEREAAIASVWIGEGDDRCCGWCGNGPPEHDDDCSAARFIDSAYALLKLDVPAVVAALMDEAKGERYVAGCERADRLDAEARADLAETTLTGILKDRRYEAERADKAERERDAERGITEEWVTKFRAMQQERDEARVKELETRTAEDHDAICRQAQRLRELSQPGYADAVRRYEFANARAEAAEALADLAERELTNVALTLEVMSNGVKKAERERDAARKERDEARDKALEEAAVYLDTLKMYGTQAKLAAAIRAMKGKP